jgi:hypothetical protein
MAFPPCHALDGSALERVRGGEDVDYTTDAGAVEMDRKLRRDCSKKLPWDVCERIVEKQMDDWVSALARAKHRQNAVAAGVRRN